MDKIVTLKVAKLAKQMGFDMTIPTTSNIDKVLYFMNISCYDVYGRVYKVMGGMNKQSLFRSDENINHYSNPLHLFNTESVYAPIQNEIFSWLRDKLIFIDIKTLSVNDKIGYAYVLNYEEITSDYLSETFETYEDAMEAALEEGLYLVTV
jgi:hypothetical protein